MDCPRENEGNKLVIITGPTAVGKSRLALKLAERYDAEIISADSMMVYRFLDIGTGKPSAEEQKKVRHHLIDIVNPDEDFDAARFAQAAQQAIAQLAKRGKRALVVGGTGFYLRALTAGLFPCSKKDMGLRAQLVEAGRGLGGIGLHEALARVDPISAARIPPKDVYRTIRALEVYHLTGIPISEHHRRHRPAEQRFQMLKLGVALERGRLYQRIERRTDRMMEQGLVEEVSDLAGRGYSWELRPLKTMIYRPVVDYLRDKLDLSQAVEAIKTASKRYAKRQLTWLSADSDIRWVDADRNGWEGLVAGMAVRFWEAN